MKKAVQLMGASSLLFLSGMAANVALAAPINLPDFTSLVEEVDASVVSVTADKRNELGQRGQSLGSGFVLSADGYLLTNWHVVEDAKEIKVQLVDGRELVAKKIGEDEESDIALLKVEASNLKAAKIGDVSKLKPGAWVVAIGAPFGFEHTVTAGIVSGKGRNLQWGPKDRYVSFIQIDVPINQGNSGGPLLNLNGEVVGINSRSLARMGADGLSFSIPIDLAMDVVAQLKTPGGVKRGFLGVSYQDVDAELAGNFGLDKARGALLRNIGKASPAEKAGLKVGDIITKIEGVTIEKSSDLPVIVGRTRPGKQVNLEIYRDGKARQVSLLVGDQKDGEGKITAGTDEQTGNGKTLGVTLSELTPAQRTEADVAHGVLIRTVEAGPAADAGLRPGDIIVSLDRKEVDTLSEFRNIWKALKPGRSIALFVVRRGVGSFVSVKVPE